MNKSDVKRAWYQGHYAACAGMCSDEKVESADEWWPYSDACHRFFPQEAKERPSRTTFTVHTK